MSLIDRLFSIRGALRAPTRRNRLALVLLAALGALAVANAIAPSAGAASRGSSQAASAGAKPAATTVQQDWKLLPTPAPTDAVLVNSTCVDAWDCWSVGGTIGDGNNNNTFAAVAEHWNGTTWSTVATKRPGKDGSRKVGMEAPGRS
jgi:hypothetical protein